MTGSSLMILAVMSFAVTHACVKALKGLPFYEVVFFRALISLALCFWSLKKSGIPMWGSDKKTLFLRGASGTVALTFYFYTLQTLPLATAVTIQYLSPLLTILISQVWLKEAARPIQWLFFISAFLGVIVLGGVEGGESLAIGLGLVAAMGSAFAYNCVRKLKDSEHEMVIILYFPLITIPCISPFVATGFQMPQGWQWFGLLAVGVFTQIAQVFMTRAYQREPASKIGIYNYLGIVIAIAVGWFFFSESLSPQAVAGIGIILFSVLASSLVRIQRKPTGQIPSE